MGNKLGNARAQRRGTRHRLAALPRMRFLHLFLAILALAAVAACSDTPPTATDAAATPEPPTVAIATPEPTARGEAYPAPPTRTVSPAPYPYPAGPTATATATREGAPTVIAEVYLPAVREGVNTPTPTPTATHTPSPTPTPTIDFRAVRAQLQTEGQDLGFVKMGFHVGPGGNQTGIGTWMERLNAAGVPFFLKSVDNAGPLTEAQEMVRSSGVPHTLVYRTSGDSYDTPDYSLPPAEAARQHWERHKEAFPPELDPGVVWMETINEVDKGRAEWLAAFSLATAQMALADGYRWAAFGWSSGEPEVADWESPAMLEFLRLVGANPERLAIALHEYSFLVEEIGHEYPFKVGRFQQLFRVADRYGIPRPTVLITEWGWAYDDVPPPGEAMEDIAWAARLYAPYPQVKGAAIWYLGPGYKGIADKVQLLIRPLTEYALGNYFPIPLPPAQEPIRPEQYAPPP
ncbi:MAG: hypothetical protein R3248_05835 [Candidatus Promineifilaceae bacterium]|nr:hypothetical protein [Candidatus Promineifilaceae bacterium]